MKKVLVVFVFLLLSCEVFSHPIPKPRKTPSTLPIIGFWTYTWARNPGVSVFRKDGSYASIWGNEIWEGSWRVDGNTLQIMESRRPIENCFHNYPCLTTITLSDIRSDSYRGTGRMKTEDYRSYPVEVSLTMPDVNS